MYLLFNDVKRTPGAFNFVSKFMLPCKSFNSFQVYTGLIHVCGLHTKTLEPFIVVMLSSQIKIVIIAGI